ncbi:LysR family transcriptional regulator [Ignatzschineria cameli]|uniref:LysR family transcriptional regulator n=1 Tax=Ignatzschineria cameli TaxID=2182793 RepID=UPI000D616F1A|nr:LysR family transcriptional regulator [Ignatzschineria cameli]PWD86110.1 hypothetical protein DC080_05010 [Ignatzschineria cameli]
MKIDKLNWTLLHTYIAIVEEQSISNAAIRLNITQSAISQNLKKLEEQLEVKLIYRSNKTFYLSEMGERLYKTASEIYSKLLKFEQTIEQSKNSIQETLSLMVVSGLVSEDFDNLLTYYHQHFPNVHLSMTTSTHADIVKKIANNHPAIGITLEPKGYEEISKLFYLPQRYSLYCGQSHPLFNKPTITQQDVSVQDYVAFDSEQLGAALSPIAIFRDIEHFTGKQVAITNNLQELQRLIITGYGIGCLPDNAAKNSLNNALLRKLPPYQGVANVPVYIIWNQNRELKNCEHAFIDATSLALVPKTNHLYAI